MKLMTQEQKDAINAFIEAYQRMIKMGIEVEMIHYELYAGIDWPDSCEDTMLDDMENEWVPIWP